MRIKSIKRVEPRKVYAIKTSSNTFIAEGLAHHNCYHCNVGLKGHWVEYLKRMRLLWGEEVVDRMLEEHNEPLKYTVDDLIKLRDIFKHDYEELIRCFNINK